MEKPPVKILYILSDGRSGSTLLDLLLGSHPRVQSLGEMKHFHRYAGTGGNVKKCTCGKNLLACPHWGRMLEGLDHDYSLPLNQAEDFAMRNYDLFLRICKVADVTWICDSSKDPGRLDLLLSSPGIDVEIIHLVRDPRAVAYSNIRKRRRVQKAKGFSLRNWREYNYVKSVCVWKKTTCATGKNTGRCPVTVYLGMKILWRITLSSATAYGSLWGWTHMKSA
jgi:hypothetical protein